MHKMSFKTKNRILPVFSTNLYKLNSLEYLELLSQNTDKDFTSDREIFESIQEEYFNNSQQFNITRFELYNIGKLLKSEKIIIRCKTLIEQHHVVSKKVLFLILQYQLKYKEEFSKILRIEKKLTDIIKICRICRNDLKAAAYQLTSSSLHIFYYCKKRKIIKYLLNILYGIKTLYCTKDSLQKHLTQENYPEVIQLISQCQKISEIYSNYDCVIALHSNLHDILEQVEENLDLSLSKICDNFDVNSYASIQTAYNFLSKSQTAVDQLHMHFTAAVHNTAYNLVSKYTICNTDIQYYNLCKLIPQERFLFCLFELAKKLIIILNSYYLIFKWHIDTSDESEKEIENKSRVKKSNKKYILQKLEHGITKINNDIENKIFLFIDGFDLTFLKFEEFIQVLNVVDRISRIGNKVCDKNVSKLRERTKEKFIVFFQFYHISKLDELKIFLENDEWELCPVKSSFEITQLLEFQTLKRILNLCHNYKSTTEHTFENIKFEIYDWTQDNIDTVISPFNIILDESTEENFLQDSEGNLTEDLSDESDDDEIPDELKYDCVDEVPKSKTHQKKLKHNGPIITNTTLSVLRICGKYLQVARLFRELTKSVIDYIIQVFELYFYTAYNFFTLDIQITRDIGVTYNTNLKRIISRIKDSLIIENTDSKPDNSLNYKIQLPSSSLVDLDDPRKLFGLIKRIVAVESLIFLGIQYESFRSYLNVVLLYETEQLYLNQFYDQTIPLTTTLRKPIYMPAIFKIFNIPNILLLMSKVNWEIKDIVSEHSNYIDQLIEKIQLFKSTVIELQNSMPLSKESIVSLWDCVACLISYTLVEGFSNAKKCTNGGRALMQLDFTQLISKFEIITALRPMPYQEYVASYIKAFYLSESSLETWIKTHTEYSVKHLMGFISSNIQNKRVKQKLMGLIEDQRSSK